jgi:hypothetical protein
MYVFLHKMEMTNVLRPPKKLAVIFLYYLLIITTYVFLLPAPHFRGIFNYTITKQFIGISIEVPTDDSRLEN